MHTQIRISLTTLQQNIRSIRSRLNTGVDFCAVLKADAYGHGATRVARAIAPFCDRFAVATVEEGISLKQDCPTMPIVVLCPSERYVSGLEYTISSVSEIVQLARGAKRRSLSVHIVVNSGMNRFGCKMEDVESILDALKRYHVTPVGIMTHFSQGENYFYTQACHMQFFSVVRRFQMSYPKLIVHCAASSALLYPEFQQDMVRGGLMMYGYSSIFAGVHPAFGVYARILRLIAMRKGDVAGYDQSFLAKRPTMLAVVSCGYADGYPRALSNKGLVEIVGELCPVVGNVCMDVLFADVTNIVDKLGISIRINGDLKQNEGIERNEDMFENEYAGLVNDEGIQHHEVVIMESGRALELSFEYNAKLLGTIPYELLTGFSSRAVRKY